MKARIVSIIYGLIIEIRNSEKQGHIGLHRERVRCVLQLYFTTDILMYTAKKKAVESDTILF